MSSTSSSFTPSQVHPFRLFTYHSLDMAPIDLDIWRSNLYVLGFFNAYADITLLLLYIVIHRVLYRAYRSLPPAQGTRHRQSNRTQHIRTFAVLAGISFALAGYHGVDYLALNYHAWATERRHSIPKVYWGHDGVFGRSGTNLHLGSWWKETNLFTDAWSVPLDSSRRLWWLQQLFLGAAGWTTYLSLEGQTSLGPDSQQCH
jgi:hypothetical protein